MELRTYWKVVVGRWWLVVGTTVLALVASVAGLMLVPRAISYTSTVRLSVRPATEQQSSLFYTYGGYYDYLSSEFLNDDVIELIEGATFMSDLRKRLQAKYADPPTGSIQAKKAHRVVTIDVTSGTADGAMALAQAASDALTDTSGDQERYFGQLTDQQPVVSVIDPPTVTAGPGSRAQLDLALRAILGLAVGIALAFLFDYLDDTVRDAQDLEKVSGMLVLGEIPDKR